MESPLALSTTQGKLLQAAPTMTIPSTIDGIYTCSAGSNDMVSRTTATLIEGVGLDGDRYANKMGTYSVLPEPGRQLTLISADSVEAALSEEQMHQLNASIGRLRRNIVLRGISAEQLRGAIGSVVRLGGPDKDGHVNSPLVFVHRNCVPCMYNERRNKVPGLMESIWETGGVSCEVIRGGHISVGDETSVLLFEESNTLAGGRIPDDGSKPDAFFVRPKIRSAEMVKSLIEGKKKTKQRLKEADNEGLLRLQHSYESVGLRF